MLDFTVESQKRFLDEFGTRAEPEQTARAPGDRRSTNAGTAPASGLLLKRRRHDSLGCAKPAPLEWSPGAGRPVAAPGCREDALHPQPSG